MKWCDHSQLVFTTRKGRSGKAKPFMGWDTETCKGDVGLLCSSFGHVQWGDPVLSIDTILPTIYQPNYQGVWWNLRYDAECIIKQLPEDHVTNLLTGERAEHVVDDHLYALKYVPKKKLSVQRHYHCPQRRRWIRERTSAHYDMAQFFNSSLNDASERFLGESKIDVDAQALGSSWDNWSNPKEIEAYCRDDAKKTRRLARLWRTWAVKTQVPFDDPLSPAFIASIKAMTQGFPKYHQNQHMTVGKAAWAAYYGGRFEARVKGWGEYYSYDLSSAYPSVMVDLPDPEVQWSRTHSETKALEQPWGFVLAEVKVPTELPWSPVMHRTDSGLIYSPVGFVGKKWFTLDEYRHVKDSCDTSFVKAWVAPDNGDRPLAWIEDLYNERAKLKSSGNPREQVHKVIMNSVYGKTLERREVRESRRLAPASNRSDSHRTVFLEGEPFEWVSNRYEIGPLFNPMLASHITGRTRCRIWEALQATDTALVATDGILTLGPLPKSMTGSGLGAWEDNGKAKGVIVGNGLYEREGERAKRRGFGAPRRTWNWIAALSSVAPWRSKLQVEYERPIHPGEAMVRHDYSLTDVGAFITDKRTYDLNDDKKRRFDFVTAGSLLTEQVTGSPLTVSHG